MNGDSNNTKAQEFTLEQASVNTLRVLACEAISNANSGHSGIALGAAPLMYAIYKNMRFDPKNGAWFNRDRFVMSAGHGSALLYSTLKCFGFDQIDLAQFRKLGSPLSGHPELDEAIGVDCSTGPLGQGIAMAVGLALAEKKLAGIYNAPAFDIINHHTFCLVGDGCLMEGVSYEACNLAGLWGLNKLIVVYDCNGITLDGTKENADCEDVVKRFKAMQWNVVVVPEGNDEYVLTRRIGQIMTKNDRGRNHAPTIIIAKTTIGHGARTAGTNKAHGQVIPGEDIKKMRKAWDLVTGKFEIDADVAEHFAGIIRKKRNSWRKWQKKLTEYSELFPQGYADLAQFIERTNVEFKCDAPGKTMTGRDAGHLMLNQIAKQTPRLIGGSADVSSTCKTFTTDENGVPDNRNIAYGIREFAMGCISNGLALHGFIPYCSTFLAFSDYARPAIRMSALMNLPVVYIFTHDGLGNAPDGPTHQAGEHIAALRLIPNMDVFRPADDYECAAIYEYIFEHEHPTCLILSRGNLQSPCGARQKDYDDPKAVLIASGAEVATCAKVQTILGACGFFVNVRSLPCIKQFELEDFDPNTLLVAVEMGSGMPWWELFGRNRLRGMVVSFDEFGRSGSDEDVTKAIGFTPELIADKILAQLNPQPV